MMSTGTTGVFATNLFMNLFMSASLQYLWDMINAQQIVILLPLFNCQLPANAGIIFNTLMQIAAFDAIPTDDIYGAIADEETFGDPINENFDMIGLETILVMPNLGSIGVIIVAYPLIYLLYYLMGMCQAFKCIRKQRKSLSKNLFWNATIRLIIESL